MTIGQAITLGLQAAALAQVGLAVGMTVGLVHLHSKRATCARALQHIMAIGSSYLIFLGISLYHLFTWRTMSVVECVLLLVAYTLGNVGLYLQMKNAPRGENTKALK